jgi:hypothetical protein
MSKNESQLHAHVAVASDNVEVQLRELDIAVRGKNVDDALRELEHAITITYQIALDLGQTPFVDLLTSVNIFESQGHSGKEFGVINLPEDVGAALAAALRMRKPVRQISVFKNAA